MSSDLCRTADQIVTGQGPWKTSFALAISREPGQKRGHAYDYRPFRPHRRAALIDNASLALPAGIKAGLVGPNGAGKSTLFRIITGEMASETGHVSIPKNTRIGQVAQEAPSEETALVEIVLRADLERTRN
jgi:ABC-type polysaccharide/polyol phosphate transport system ATPase subunit